MDDFNWRKFKSDILLKDNGEAFTTALGSHSFAAMTTE